MFHDYFVWSECTYAIKCAIKTNFSLPADGGVDADGIGGGGAGQ